MTTAAANLLYRQIRDSPKLAGINQVEIARRAKIHQSQVSRIMSGQFKRVTAPSVIKLCEFARIKWIVDKPLSPKLQNLLNGVWDGSRVQEQALVQLLKAVEALAIAGSTTIGARIPRVRGKEPLPKNRPPPGR